MGVLMDRTVRYALCVALTLLAPFPGLGASCSCADIPDIENRLVQASAAIAQYQAQIALIESQERMTGKVIMATEDTYSIANPNSLESRVNDALTKVNTTITGPLNRASSSTDGTCKVTIKGASACMRADLEQHEAVHVAICEKGRGSTRLADMAREEIQSWESERKHLQAELDSLAPSCKLPDWFGTVTYLEKVHAHSLSTDPGSTSVAVVTHESEANYERAVTVTIFQNFAYVQESFDKTTSSHVFGDELISCHSNQTPVSYYKSATSRSTESGTGFEWSALAPRLTNTGYGMTFRTPEYDALLDVSHERTSSPCGNTPVEPPVHAVVKHHFTSIAINGKFGAGGAILEGDDTPVSSVAADGSTSVTVSKHWKLYRGMQP